MAIIAGLACLPALLADVAMTQPSSPAATPAEGGGVAIGPARVDLPTADLPTWSLSPGEAARAAAADQASGDLVGRGRYLAAVGDCMDCHTNPGAKPYSGARPLKTPFGVIYAANLTPDPQAGIGAWTSDQFYRALHQGVRNDGARLYPAFPYPYFTHASRADAEALRAYLATLEPVRQPQPANRLIFPLNLRVVLNIWNWLFFHPAEFKPNPAQSDEWNRGAYIVQSLGHCGACHTPKNFLAADRNNHALEGGKLDDWVAANLTGEPRAGLGSWTRDELIEYLRYGRNDRAAASGAMTDVIYFSTSRMSDADLGAIATYLKSLPAGGAAASPPAPNQAAMGAGEAIYVDSCAACHRTDGRGVPGFFPPLQQGSSLQGRDATTIIRVILEGTRSVPTPGRPTPLAMPSYAWKLDDAQIASVATYIRNSWGNAAAPVNARDVHRLRSRVVADQNAGPS